jgi:peptidoglycan/xylan/chitin deacetylase (PgdA/CDA1 family)
MGSMTRRDLKARLGAVSFRAQVHRFLLRNTAVVVAFHRVDDRFKGNPISCTVDEFREFCDFFQQNFYVISTTELLERIRTGADLGGRLVITFDDGYLDNYENAAPELEARGLPATFFISSGLIGSTRRPWWDEEYGAESEWMNWDQVRSLHSRGFEIGGHTVNHVDLGVVSETVAIEEVRGCKEMLEKELDDRITLFAYPYGRPHQITEANRSIVRSHDFQCCFSCHGGIVVPGSDPYRLQRTPITPWHISPGQFGFELLFRK